DYRRCSRLSTGGCPWRHGYRCVLGSQSFAAGAIVPATTQGASSAPQTLTAVNSGNAPLQVSSISLTGSNAAEFGVSSTCTAPLAPAASCSISLVFSPTASGQSSANLVIADDAPNSPQTIALSATAN